MAVAQPVALQMSLKEAPFTSAQEDATLLVDCSQTPIEPDTPWIWYAKEIASTIQWAIFCLGTAFPFCCPPKQTKS